MWKRQLGNEEDAPARDNEPQLRIAIATRDLTALDSHFGSARRFAVYDVTPGGSRLVKVVEFETFSDQSGAHKDDGEDRIGPKVEALVGCQLLFVLAIGGPAAVKVVNARIHPVKLPNVEPVESVIRRVQEMMTGNPPPWLRRVMTAGTNRSMEFLE